MEQEIIRLKNKAEEYRYLYNTGKITREEAKINIMPYLNKLNEKSLELAKKYNQKHKKITFSNFIR